jgi:Tfp pilus assembly protein PilF
MSTSSPPSGKRNSALPLILLLLLVGGGIAAYRFWPGKPVEDLPAAMAANQRGIGQLEQYEYGKAATEFEQAVKSAPNWLPAQVNLAIALMNQNTKESKERAEGILTEVIKRDPDNKHARFCLGIVLYDRTQLKEAYEQFAMVNKLDPDDAHTWLRMGGTHPKGNESDEARKCYEEALKRNPYLNAARYGLFLGLRAVDPDRAMKVLADFEALKAADWEHQTRIIYTEMGKYADAIGSGEKPGKPEIGPLPVFETPKDFKVTLAAGAKWAAVTDLDPIRKAARDRFGAVIVLFDYNRDGRPDVFILSAVVENGTVRDVLLKNEGNFAFTDVTADAGLAKPRPSLGAAVADYDNDGQIDLLVTGDGEQHLFRNKGDGKFEDVSAAAGLDQIKGICLGSGWADLDQDGDLDLLVCKYTEKFADFTKAENPTGSIEFYENVGVYPPGQQGSLMGLTTKFRRDDRLAKIAGPCNAVSVVIADLDNDNDPDVLVLRDHGPAIFIENDRLLRFQLAQRKGLMDQITRTNGGMVLGINHDRMSDLFVLGAGAMLRAKNGREFEATPVQFKTELKQAVAVDIDRDSWTDIVGLSSDGNPEMLRNQGDDRLHWRGEELGKLEAAFGIAVADMDGNCTPDLVLLTKDGLQIRRGLDNGNGAIAIEPTGRRKPVAQGPPRPERTNADGIGCRISIAAGAFNPEAERATVSAGLGQSLLPTVLGIGKAGQAEFVRVQWPDMVYQTELGIAGCAGVFKMTELERKPDSCPALMTWDGEKFVFVTDILGGGALGEVEPDGVPRPPRPEESVKIEHWQMKPRNGRYVLKLGEPMDEVMYLDHVRLDVVDHPSDVEVHPDERFATAPPLPTQDLLAFRTRRFAKTAIDHRGVDHAKTLLERDRKFVEGFALRSWLGFAEDHALTLDFGELPPQGDARWHVVLAGWTEYAYPDSIYSASRAGVPLNVPVLERLMPDGKSWKAIGELGFPAGLPRVMTFPLNRLAPGPCSLRIRTNMQIYWDQIYLAPEQSPTKSMKVTSLEPLAANLAYRGFAQEVHPDGKPPVSYDDSKTEAVSVNKWKGNLTQFGDVTELLKSFDDRLMIGGPGDEVTVEFDAEKLPPLPAGWTRSFVLRTSGYCKGTAPTTATRAEVGPLPFKAMKNYPGFGAAAPVTDAAKWHTRPAGGK